MKLSPLAALVAVALLLGVFFTAGCGGGGESEGPTASWTIANSGGTFSGVSGARFGYGTRNSSNENVIAKCAVLDQDSATVSLRHSLPRSISPVPGRDFNVYLPVVWRDSDRDQWPDDWETQFMWRDSTYIYALNFGTSESDYPGWSKWRLWYSGGYAYKQWMYNIEDEIAGTIYTSFYSSYSLDDAPDRTVTSKDFIGAVEVAPE